MEVFRNHFHIIYDALLLFSSKVSKQKQLNVRREQKFRSRGFVALLKLASGVG